MASRSSVARSMEYFFGGVSGGLEVEWREVEWREGSLGRPSLARLLRRRRAIGGGGLGGL